jgi:hypothetical protein
VHLLPLQQPSPHLSPACPVSRHLLLLLCLVSCALHLSVQYLSRKGADLEAEDPQARLPLHHAAAAGKGVEALRYLIQHSTWLSAPDAADDTPLHLAARYV